MTVVLVCSWTKQTDFANGATFFSSEVSAVLAGTSGAPRETNCLAADSDASLLGAVSERQSSAVLCDMPK